MKKLIRIKIYGRVQGVGFRFAAARLAARLELHGFASNQADGTVLFEVEGEEKNLIPFLGWCRLGPPLAQVTKLEFSYGKRLKNFTEFKIL